jgi:hypothetical protein
VQFPTGTEIMLEYQTDENKFVRPEPVKKDWRNFEVNDVIDAKVRALPVCVRLRVLGVEQC